MVMHPHDAETVYILPLEADVFRCTPEGKLRVYRTRDAGGHWEPLTRGLPQKNALECVLRDAMCADKLNPAGIYFGTRSGTLWGSRDGGASWGTVFTGLPPITCVKAAVIGGARATRRPRPHAAARANTRPAAGPKARAAGNRAPAAGAPRGVRARRTATARRG